MPDAACGDNSCTEQPANRTLHGMTIDAFEAHSQPLLTERDMISRIDALLAPASNPAQLWVLILDSLRRQTPVIIPIDDRPELPNPRSLNSLARALREIVQGDADGPGSAIFVIERLGTDRITAADLRWAAALAGACERARVTVTGTFLLSPHRVSPLGA